MAEWMATKVNIAWIIVIKAPGYQDQYHQDKNNHNHQDNYTFRRLCASCQAKLTLLVAMLCTHKLLSLCITNLNLVLILYTSNLNCLIIRSSWSISPQKGPNHLQHRPLPPPHQPHKRVWFIIVVSNIQHECCTHCYCQYWHSSIVYYFHVMSSTSTINTSNLNFNTPWHVVAVSEVSFVAIASNLKKEI